MKAQNASAQETTGTIRVTIIKMIEQVAEEQGKTLPSLSDDAPLAGSHLDSLRIAIIVARLDDQLNLDSFTGANDIMPLITFGDFIRLHENAAA